MKKYLYEVRPNRPVVNKQGRTTRCPFSDLLTKEDVMGYMKSANIWRRFPDGVVRVTGQNLDLLHRESMNNNYEENLSNSEVKVTVVEPKEEEEVIPVETVEEVADTKEVVEEPEVETPVEEAKEEVPTETVEDVAENKEVVEDPKEEVIPTETVETTETVSDSLEDNAQINENTVNSEAEEVKNEAVEEVSVVSQEEPKKEHQNVVINAGNQNRNIQVNSKNNKNYKR